MVCRLAYGAYAYPLKLLDILHLSATNRGLHKCFLNHRKTIMEDSGRQRFGNYDLAMDLCKFAFNHMSVLS